jgi:hypothetical protein
MIKWLNDLLPFQARMQKYGQSSLAGCPEECGCESEIHSHLLHCPVQHRLDLFLPLETDLETLFTSHKIDPYLRKVLLILLAPYWGSTLDFDLSTEYENLVTFQQQLHTDSLFLDCFSTEWARLQMAYLQLNNLPRKRGQVATGLGTIAGYLLELTHSVWLKCKNAALHGDESTTKLLSYKHTQLLLDIQDLYDQSDSMLATDRVLFTKPYEYWISQPTNQLLTFLKRMKTTVKFSVTQAADMGAHFRSIDSYFPPVIPAHHFKVILGTPYVPPVPDIPPEPD